MLAAAEIHRLDASSRIVLAALPVAIYTTDAQGRITFYNEAAARLWNREPKPGERFCAAARLLDQNEQLIRPQDNPIAMALKTGARIMLAYNRRLPGARFHVTVSAPLDFTPSGDEAKDTLGLTAAITAGIEAMVRVDPGQWLWIHNRWPTARDAAILQGRA